MVEVASDSTDLIARVSEYVEETVQVDAIRAAYDFAASATTDRSVCRATRTSYIRWPLPPSWPTSTWIRTPSRRPSSTT